MACKTKQLLISSSKTIALSTRQYKLTRRHTNNYLFRNIFNDTVVNPATKWNFRLCDCRHYHSSREPRSTFAKLTPQEVSEFT